MILVHTTAFWTGRKKDGSVSMLGWHVKEPHLFLAQVLLDSRTNLQPPAHLCVVHNYTPRNEVRGGYTGITLSVRLSVHL